MTWDQFSSLASCLTGIGTMILAVAALLALRTWKKETRYGHQLELTRKMARLVLRSQRDYQAARGAFPYQSGRTRSPQPNETEAIKSIRDRWFDKKEQVSPLYETLNELTALTWEAQIVFRGDYSILAKTMMEMAIKLSIEIDNYCLLQESATVIAPR